MLSYNKNLKNYSQKLRGNMTDAEKLLWSKLKFKQAKGLQFYRQKVIGNTSFSVMGRNAEVEHAYEH